MSSYRQILKSTALLGGSQVIVTIIGLARNKALAILLGPAGLGLAGLYTSVTTLVGTITGLGIGNSGVRQIARANQLSDKTRVARIVIVITRVLFLSNIIGALVICAFSRRICRATFGDDQNAFGVVLMSIVLLFTGISASQMAILQGLQRIRDMVSCQILGAVFGTVASIIIVYLLRDRGVAWFLVANAAFAILTSWWFARRVHFAPMRVSLKDMLLETKALAGLGIALMSAAVLGSVVAYFTRLFIVHQLGMQAAGQFQAASTLSSYYVGFILNAMGTDFYPRLSALSKDNAAANRLMHEQIEVGLMLAIPGIAATLVLAPWVLRLFYSREFMPAAGIVQWQVIGVFFRIISWSLWHLTIAKGLGRLFVLSECLFAMLQIVLNYGCIVRWGLQGVGIAYLLVFVVHVCGMYALCRRVSGFTWSRRCLLISLPGVLLLLLSLGAMKVMSVFWGAIVGFGFCVAACVAALYGLQKVIGASVMDVILRRLTGRTAN